MSKHCRPSDLLGSYKPLLVGDRLDTGKSPESRVQLAISGGTNRKRRRALRNPRIEHCRKKVGHHRRMSTLSFVGSLHFPGEKQDDEDKNENAAQASDVDALEQHGDQDCEEYDSNETVPHGASVPFQGEVQRLAKNVDALSKHCRRGMTFGIFRATDPRFNRLFSVGRTPARDRARNERP